MSTGGTLGSQRNAAKRIVMRINMPDVVLSRVRRRRQREGDSAREPEEAVQKEAAAESLVVHEASGPLSNKELQATAGSEKVELEIGRQHALTEGSAAAASVTPHAQCLEMAQNAQCQRFGANAGGTRRVARSGSVQGWATRVFKHGLSLDVEPLALQAVVDVRNEEPAGPSFWAERGMRIPLGRAWRELDWRETENTNCFTLSPSSSCFRRKVGAGRACAGRGAWPRPSPAGGVLDA